MAVHQIALVSPAAMQRCLGATRSARSSKHDAIGDDRGGHAQPPLRFDAGRVTSSAWFGPITSPVVVIPPVDITGLVDQMWSTLLTTTITGKQYKQRGQPDTGSWGAAKALRDQIKAS